MKPLTCPADGWLTLNSGARAQSDHTNASCGAFPAVLPAGAGAEVPGMGALTSYNKQFHNKQFHDRAYKHQRVNHGAHHHQWLHDGGYNDQRVNHGAYNDRRFNYWNYNHWRSCWHWHFCVWPPTARGAGARPDRGCPATTRFGITSSSDDGDGWR